MSRLNVRGVLMLFAFIYRFTVGEAEQRRLRDRFMRWTPPPTLDVKFHYAFASGGGVAVTGSAVVLAATTTTPPPYSLASASRKVAAVKGTIAVPAGNLADGVNTPANPAAGVSPVAGSTVYGGNFEAAIVQMTR